MFYLGIDIGKNTHVASLMDEKTKVIFKAHSFSNTSDDATTLLGKITPYTTELEIGMEATGHYCAFTLFTSCRKPLRCTCSLILFKPMVGAKELKSESIKQISLILFSLQILSVW